MITEPLGVFAFANSSRITKRYHAIFPADNGREELLGCFETKQEAAEAWDRRARQSRWGVANRPNLKEQAATDLLEDKFDFYRSQGFPYPPSDAPWRGQQLEELLEHGPAAAWKSEKLLQLGDHELAPGLQLCWSFHPHSFAVSKTRGMKDNVLELKPNPLETFNSDAGLLKSLRTCIERCGDPSCLPLTLRGECKFHDDSWDFKGGGSWITNFQPLVAAAIYARYGGTGGVVYDSSAGWGGRMLGARVAGVRKYIACEPNSETFRGLQELAAFAAGPLEVELHQVGSEDFQPETVDMAFTSPPYFNTECYSREPTQSFVKFPTARRWCDGFLRPTLAKTLRAVKPGGYMLISISGRRMQRRAGLDLVAEVQRLATELGAMAEPTLLMQKLDQSEDTAQPIYVFRKAR